MPLLPDLPRSSFYYYLNASLCSVTMPKPLGFGIERMHRPAVWEIRRQEGAARGSSGFPAPLLASACKVTISHHPDRYCRQHQLNYCVRRRGPRRKDSGFVPQTSFRNAASKGSVGEVNTGGEEAQCCAALGALPYDILPLDFQKKLFRLQPQHDHDFLHVNRSVSRLLSSVLQKCPI